MEGKTTRISCLIYVPWLILPSFIRLTFSCSLAAWLPLLHLLPIESHLASQRLSGVFVFELIMIYVRTFIILRGRLPHNQSEAEEERRRELRDLCERSKTKWADSTRDKEKHKSCCPILGAADVSIHRLSAPLCLARFLKRDRDSFPDWWRSIVILWYKCSPFHITSRWQETRNLTTYRFSQASLSSLVECWFIGLSQSLANFSGQRNFKSSSPGVSQRFSTIPLSRTVNHRLCITARPFGGAKRRV